jgi:integrase
MIDVALAEFNSVCVSVGTGISGECNRHLGERPKRTDARADGCYIGWKESAAGVEPAHWTGKAATLTGDLAHDLSILIIVGRQLVQQCPLAPTVGEAIRHYLQEVRLQRPSRHVFLTLRASYGPLSRSALWKVVSDRLRPLKLSVRHQGPHSLRHACATPSSGARSAVDGNRRPLGHQNPKSTSVYAAAGFI